MTATTITRLLFRGALLAGVGVALAVVPSVVQAGERIQFKNGHTIEVMSSREEGEMVYVRLRDGSEAGFPKSIIQEVETNRAVSEINIGEGTNWSGRGPALTDLHGYRALVQQSERFGGMTAFATAPNRARIANDPRALPTFGFGWNGSSDISRANQGHGAQERISSAQSTTAPMMDNEFATNMANRPDTPKVKPIGSLGIAPAKGQ